MVKSYKKHDASINTIEVMPFEDQVTTTAFALMFSEYNCIVKSKMWANAVIEDGCNSTSSSSGRTHSLETKLKMSNSHLGKPCYHNTKGIKFKRTKPAWNKGLKTGPQTKETIDKRAGKLKTIVHGPLDQLTKDKISSSMKNKPWSEARRAAQRK